MHRDGPRPNRFSPASRGLLVEFHLGASQWVLLPHCCPLRERRRGYVRRAAGPWRSTARVSTSTTAAGCGRRNERLRRCVCLAQRLSLVVVRSLSLTADGGWWPR